MADLLWKDRKSKPKRRFTPGERCAAIAPKGHDYAGARCGDYAGHSGPHTALIASQFLVARPPEGGKP